MHIFETLNQLEIGLLSVTFQGPGFTRTSEATRVQCFRVDIKSYSARLNYPIPRPGLNSARNLAKAVLY